MAVVSEGRVERALADLVGGWGGGETLFELACARLARQAREYADEPARFGSHPRGMLHRLEVACRDALHTVEVAVELHESLDYELPSEERAAQLADLLLARARRLASDRQLPEGEAAGTSGVVVPLAGAETAAAELAG